MVVGMSKTERSPITTHILDIHLGKPATDVVVLLDRKSGPEEWTRVAQGRTNADGRIEDLLPRGSRAEKGIYQLTFETQPYFERVGSKVFYPQVRILFDLAQPDQHYHVPLLLSAHGYSTYRGT
jgi:5-hydroxyisourate hydrolase